MPMKTPAKTFKERKDTIFCAFERSDYLNFEFRQP